MVTRETRTKKRRCKGSCVVGEKKEKCRSSSFCRTHLPSFFVCAGKERKRATALASYTAVKDGDQREMKHQLGKPWPAMCTRLSAAKVCVCGADGEMTWIAFVYLFDFVCFGEKTSAWSVLLFFFLEGTLPLRDSGVWGFHCRGEMRCLNGETGFPPFWFFFFGVG